MTPDERARRKAAYEDQVAADVLDLLHRLADARWPTGPELEPSGR